MARQSRWEETPRPSRSRSPQPTRNRPQAPLAAFAVWATAALAALVAAQAGGCFQASGLGDITFVAPDGGAGGGTGSGGMPGPDGGPKCTSAAECDDKDPCTADACTAGHCEHKAEPDGAACTIDGSPGQCSGGKCESSGCLNGTVCPSTGPCQTSMCNGATGNCEYTNVPDGTPTPGVTPVAGDCKQHLCLAGKDTAANDDADIPTLPAAMAGCADATCNNGTPSFPLHATGSPCSTWMGTMPGFCDATGACVQCTEDSDCPGPSTDCQHPACTNAACMQVFASSGKPTTSNPPQLAGDCQQIVCDGMGATKTIADPTDVPGDPTGCNPGVCNGSTPSHMEAPNGTTCLGGCGATISCSVGRCTGCTTDCQCQDAGKFPNAKCQTLFGCECAPSTCAALGLTCGTAPDGCGGTVNCGDGKQDGSETDVDCGGSAIACAARCAQGKKCVVTADCASGLTCADGVLLQPGLHRGLRGVQRREERGGRRRRVRRGRAQPARFRTASAPRSPSPPAARRACATGPARARRGRAGPSASPRAAWAAC